MNIETILVPTDFSGDAARALEYAIDLAKTFGARIQLVHAYDINVLVVMPGAVSMPDRFWDDVRQAAERRLEEVRKRVEAEGVKCESELHAEGVVQSILDAAGSADADLIVMGTRGHSGLKHVLLGSVADRVVRMAPCPVMTVKDDAE